MSTTITTVDPATGCDLATYDVHDDTAIERLLDRAHRATLAWGRTPVQHRCEAVARLGQTLLAERDRLADLVTAEMGKTLAEARAEVEKCAAACAYYAEQAPSMLADEHVNVGTASAHVAHEPLGLVLAVMPWNFPLWQVVRFAAPAIAAGNGMLLKQSPNVTGCALAIQELAQVSGVPVGVVTTLVVEEERVPRVTERLIADDRVAAVTLTGSNRAGAAVGAAAGRNVKKSVLELGGSDAFVVLADADLESAAAAAVRARFQNAGQSCICAKRFVVVDEAYEVFVRLFLDRVGDLVVGDPRDPATTTGPMARADLRDGLHRQVQESLDRGAALLAGGAFASGPGYGYVPTVLAAGPGTPVFDEETFGPVAAVVRASGDREAAELAGATPYGLGLSVWTANPVRAAALAREVITGAVFVNAVTASDPRVPFGGTRQSGYGRELSSHGLREFVNTRTYWIAASG